MAERSGCTSEPLGCWTVQMWGPHSLPSGLGSPHSVTSTWASEVQPGLRSTVGRTLRAACLVKNVGSGVGAPGLVLSPCLPLGELVFTSPGPV